MDARNALSTALSLFLALILSAPLLSSCIATAPITVALRSSTSQQTASTEGQAQKQDKGDTNIAADKTNDFQTDTKVGKTEQ